MIPDEQIEYIQELQWTVMRLAARQMHQLDFYINALELVQNAESDLSSIEVRERGYKQASQIFEYLAERVAEDTLVERDRLSVALFYIQAAKWAKAGGDIAQGRVFAKYAYKALNAVPDFLHVQLRDGEVGPGR